MDNKKKGIMISIAAILVISVFAGMFSPASAADKVDLFFLVDGSNSISAENFTLQKEALAYAINDSSVIPEDSDVSVCVILFGYKSTPYAKVVVSPTTINSQSTADSVSAKIIALSQPRGSTRLDAAFDCAVEYFPSDPSGRQVIDLATDGRTAYPPLAKRSRDAALDKGFDEVNTLGVGTDIDETFLKNLVSPQPHTSAPGFYMHANSYHEFRDKMRDKIIKEVQSTPTPTLLTTTPVPTTTPTATPVPTAATPQTPTPPVTAGVPQITISQTSLLEEPEIGEEAVLTVTLRNAGDGIAKNIQLTERIPSSVSITYVDGADKAGNLVIWTGDLNPGELHSIQHTFRILEAKNRFFTARVTYEDAVGNKRETSTEINIMTEVPTPTPTPIPTPPGFEAAFVIVGLLAVAYLLRRGR